MADLRSVHQNNAELYTEGPQLVAVIGKCIFDNPEPLDFRQRQYPTCSRRAKLTVEPSIPIKHCCPRRSENTT